MPLFLVAKSRRTNGHFEVHCADCPAAPPPPHSHYLGSFPSAARAICDARVLYPRCEGCEQCCAADALPDEEPDRPRRHALSGA
ncbi:hypothetical protein [Chiayiivirga flava]|uniref:Uncharacterized protein n=1 Tax=Chiayiivirga flava TaxID=659595 RepID=A0A7W8D5R2_9GAMM|nr:hypothetical protein [Chiayiivirga flava]MBB5208421.1 hypothetical protein [Chiayiivirga flava]